MLIKMLLESTLYSQTTLDSLVDPDFWSTGSVYEGSSPLTMCSQAIPRYRPLSAYSPQPPSGPRARTTSKNTPLPHRTF